MRRFVSSTSATTARRNAPMRCWTAFRPARGCIISSHDPCRPDRHEDADYREEDREDEADPLGLRPDQDAGAEVRAAEDADDHHRGEVRVHPSLGVIDERA